MTLHHACQLKQAPFTKSIVLGKDWDRDFRSRDCFEKFRADLFSDTKLIIVPESANTGTNQISVEKISDECLCHRNSRMLRIPLLINLLRLMHWH